MAHSNELREFVLTDRGLEIAANGSPKGVDRHAAL
jgi:hypothetical protein